MDHNLTPEQLDSFGREVLELHLSVKADVGEADVRYIRRVITAQRALAVLGRGLLFASFFPPAWVAGTACLSLAKIIENMEIGHNVLHGQYDFARAKDLDSQTYEWDHLCPSDQWRHSHNYLHHTYTNVRGVDHDLGYRILRVTEEQPWHPGHLLQPLYAAWLALSFQLGVGLHDVDVRRFIFQKKSERDPDEARRLREIGKKALRQALPDYVFFPLFAGPHAPAVFLGNLVANLVRNVWSFTVIFCGHFPDGTATFDPSCLTNESTAHFYLRQLMGSANFEGGRVTHFLSGHLSHQIEHHMFPDIPAHRYPAMAKRLRVICAKYGLRYNTGSLFGQFKSVVKKLFRLALPGRHRAPPALAAA